MDAIVFDWDGTLMDSLAAVFDANAKVLGEYGVPFDEERYRAAYTPDWRVMYQRLGLPEAAMAAAGDRWLELYADTDDAMLLPGAAEALGRLVDAGYVLGLVTAGDQVVVEAQMERLGVAGLLPIRVYGSDDVASKPHPEPLLRALDQLDRPDFPPLARDAGQLADVYSKRSVLVAFKIFEILVMTLALIAFAAGGIDSMLAIVFLMGVHTAFFSPAKYGILPEMLPVTDLSRGNGLLEMSTFVAIILGTSLSGPIYVAWKDRPAWIGALLVAIAVVGTWTSLGIPKVPPAAPGGRRLRLNPFGEIWDGIKRLYPDRPLWLTVLGLSYFWFVGALVQLDTQP